MIKVHRLKSGSPKGFGYLKPVSKLRVKSSARVARPTAVPRGKADNRGFIKSVLDQQWLGSCFWFAIVQMRRALRIKLGDPDPILESALMGYYNTRVIQRDVEHDTGCDPYSGVAAAEKWGVCPEKSWPYLPEKYADLPRQSSVTDHDPYALAADSAGEWGDVWVYSSGATKVDDVKLLLDSGYIVAIGGPVGEEYCNWKAGDPPLKAPSNFDPNDPSYAGHMRCLTGYDGDILDELGSWSDEFGDGGYVKDDASLIEWPYSDAIFAFTGVPKP